MSKKIHIGGQAVMEGVMIKTKKNLVISVRKPNGKITTKKQKLKPISEKIKFFGWPFIRGIVELIEILIIGIKALNYSANESIDKKEEKITSKELMITLFIAFGFAFLLFKFLPLLITKFIFNKGVIGSSRTIFNLIDGLLRISMFILYILVISRLKDVKRLFQYHGAEHKAVNCFEAGKKLTPKNIKKYSTLHPRCGTSFIFIVLFVAILIFSIVKIDINFWLLLVLRIPLILPVAGISYEILKLSDKFKNNAIFNSLSKPGLWLQKITTKEPDKKQIEVAIEAVKGILKLEKIS
ncbi:DUF1385 domain-containing protein [Candidatus Woesearchaeota archaeon]|nr:DUF1385 domain-containing protein [Candidatus Woesearchaeota archaeon]